MIDTVRLTIGLVILFGGLFIASTAAFYWMCDRKFWKSVGSVALVYLVCGAFVFFIIAVVAWSFDVTMLEVIQ